MIITFTKNECENIALKLSQHKNIPFNKINKSKSPLKKGKKISKNKVVDYTTNKEKQKIKKIFDNFFQEFSFE